MSLFPLGLLSQGGGGSGGGPAYDLIQTVSGTGTSGTITFTDIPQTYKHLQIRYVARDNGNTTVAQPVTMRYNGQTSTYRSHSLSSYGSSVISETSTTMVIGWIPASFGASGSYGAGVIDILDYTNANKTASFRSLNGYTSGGSGDGYPNGTAMVALTSGMRTATTAITSLTFIAGWQWFESASRFSLYGIKG
jgi:hypothetical protein